MIENKLINSYHHNHHHHLHSATSLQQQQECLQFNDSVISSSQNNNNSTYNQLIQNSNILTRNSPTSFNLNSLSPPPLPLPPLLSATQNSTPQLYNLTTQQSIAMISTTTSPPTPPLSVTSSQVPCKLNNSKLNSSSSNKQQQQQNDTLLECNGCHSYIQERYYLLVMDRAWHIDCLRCNSCKSCLDTQMSCFIKDGMIYCKDDYFKLFPRKCQGCCTIISPDQLIMRAKQYIFHIKCFKCISCDKHLNTGDEYGIKEGSILCRTHFYNDSDLNNNNNNNNNEIVSNIKFEPFTNFDFKHQPTTTTYYSQLYSPIGTDALPTPSSSSSTSSSSSYFNLGHPQHQQQHQQHFDNNNNHNYYLCNMPPTPGYSPPNSLIQNSTSTNVIGTPINNETMTSSTSTPNKTLNLSSPASTTVINQKGRPKKRKLAANSNDNVNVNININDNNNSNNDDLINMNKQAKITTVTSSTTNITEPLSPKHKKNSSKIQRNDSNTDLLDEDDINNSIHDDDDNSIDNSKFMPNSPDYFSDDNCFGNDLQANGSLNAGGYFDSASVAAAAAAAAAAQRQKRMRTSFKHHQLRVMKTYFELNHNPDAKDLKQLSQKTGLSKRVLQVWFQNARAKYRRNQSSNEPNSSNTNTPSMHQGNQQQNSSNNMSENLTTVNSLSSLSTSSNSSTNSATSQNLLIQQLNGYSTSNDIAMSLNNLNSLHSHHHIHSHHQMHHQQQPQHHAHHNMFSNDTLNELDLIQNGQHNNNGHLIKLDNEINEEYQEAQSQQHMHSLQQALSMQANDDLLIN